MHGLTLVYGLCITSVLPRTAHYQAQYRPLLLAYRTPYDRISLLPVIAWTFWSRYLNNTATRRDLYLVLKLKVANTRK